MYVCSHYHHPHSLMMIYTPAAGFLPSILILSSSGRPSCSLDLTLSMRSLAELFILCIACCLSAVSSMIAFNGTKRSNYRVILSHSWVKDIKRERGTHPNLDKISDTFYFKSNSKCTLSVGNITCFIGVSKIIPYSLVFGP